MTQPASRLRSIAYRSLIATAPIARTRIGASVWQRLWDTAVADGDGVTTLTLHGQRAVINVGHPYPAFMRRWPTYNSPLVELVHQAAAAAGRPVTVVDVGASVGDTVLLVRARCPGEVGAVWCIEGDDTFVEILHANFDGDDSVHLVHALASNGESHIPGLVRGHAGTASPRGDVRVAAAPLDALVGAAAVDVLKIDTDGYDGQVLAGASEILARDQPAVLFEWHPILAAAAGVSLDIAFNELDAAGYRRFFWYDKFGYFSHAEIGPASEERAALAARCVAGGFPVPDWHYDVVALPDRRGVDETALQGLMYSAARRE